MQGLPVRVLVCEPSPAGVSALLASLETDPRLRPQPGPADADMLVTAAESIAARVMVVGPTFPRAGLAPAIGQVLQHGCRVLVVAEDRLDDRGAQLLLAGASGYLLMRDATPAALCDAVFTVASGASALHPDVVDAVFERWRQAHMATNGWAGHQAERSLTARELDVLRGLNEGLTNRALANRLGVAEKTIEAHKSHLYAKLGARNQSHAVRIAADRGIL